MQWVFQTGATGHFQATPLVIDGIMYLTGQDNRAYALDARTGRAIWRYQRTLPQNLPLCCGLINRGLAALGDKVFLATLDAHVLALDAKTGNVIWDVEAVDYRKGYVFTVAPLVVKDKVVVGVSGGEYGIRGFIDAYEAETGKRAWRFYTIPAPGEPGNETWAGDSWKSGSAPAWLTGSYDPELNLIYWGTGNPGPDFYGAERKGDNLYSASVVALDADTGKLKWYFQFTPHDLHDWDAAQIPVLLDLEYQGRPRKLMAWANRNGFFYLLDRTDGQFLFGKPFVHVTWAKEIGPDGRPVRLPNGDPTPEGTYICPGITGGTNWMSPSFSPQTGYFYVTAREECTIFFTSPQKYRTGQSFLASAFQVKPDEKSWGALRAIDPKTGQIKWEFKYHSPSWGGTLATLAEVPKKHGVKNLYAELGTTFGSSVVTHPRLAAAILGQLIAGFGADRVLWGTDSIWYGSPQWQIEALRRLEIPADLQEKYGFAPLGPATGPVKRAIFGLNTARVFGVDVTAERNPVPPDFQDRLAKMKAEYQEGGPEPSNTYYGWVRKRA